MNHSFNIRREISYLFLLYQTRDNRPRLTYIWSSQSSEKNANDKSVQSIQLSTEGLIIWQVLHHVKIVV